MSNANYEAANMYAKHQAEVTANIERLREALKLHDDKQAANAWDWRYAGDLREVNVALLHAIRTLS